MIRWIEPEDRTVLDLGCGTGGNARTLTMDGREIDGVTLSADEAALAAGTMRQVVVHNLETGLPKSLPGPYDVVLASHVLEHLCFPSALLQDIRASLAPKGRLVVALPNLLKLNYRLRLLLGRFEYESGGIMDDTHFRWYTFESAQRLLETAGFQIRHAYAEGHLPLGPMRKWLPQTWAKKLDGFVCRLFPGLFGAQMIYVAVNPSTGSHGCLRHHQ